jgi:hypothetical protein
MKVGVPHSCSLQKTNVIVATEIWDTFELLPHFLDHYKRLGCARVLIAVAGANKGILSTVEEIAERAQIETKIQWFDSAYYDNDMNQTLPKAMLDQENLNPNDWVIYADLDEFQEYPASLHDVVEESIRQNIQAISSEWLDRVTRNGRLPPIQMTPTIGEQFPIGCRLSSRRLRSFSSKILMCRWKCNMGCAGHHQLPGYPADKWPIGTKAQYIVHHFKWNSGVLARLARRLDPQANVNVSYAAECQQFLELYAESGRIDFTGLDARECGALKYY